MEENEKKLNNVQAYNVGTSDYARHTIQPWDIWLEYGLNAWEADIIKRILRTKGTTPEDALLNKKTDIQKIKHICDYLLTNFNEVYKNEIH